MVDPAQVLDGLRPLHISTTGIEGATPVVAMAVLGCAAALVCSRTLGPWLMRRRALRRSALDELATTRALADEERLLAQAALLRRVVGALDGDAAHQRGDAWLARLDATFSTRFFSRERGQAFGDALYRPPAEPDIEALDAALEDIFARIEQ